MTYKQSYFMVGIDPAGIGTTGIVIKTFDAKYPRKFLANIKATNPVQAAEEINAFIQEKKEILERDEIKLKEVVVEIPHDGVELLKEVKATRELVGILKFQWKNKFRGHLPQHKSKEFIKSLKNNNWTSHVIDAHAILYAHIHETENDHSCRNYAERVINGEK